MNRWFLMFPVKVLGGLLMLVLAWQFWVFLQPRPRVLTPEEANAVQLLARDVGDRLAVQVQGPARFGVAHFIGDERDALTDAVREELATRAGWTVEQGSIIEKFLEDIGRAIARATSIEEIVQAGQKVELDVLVAGRVLALETTNGAGRAVAQVYAYDLRPGAWVVRETLTAAWTPNALQQAGRRMQQASPMARLAIWIAVVVLLPWLTAFATHRALERKSNFSSFVVLGSYTLAGVALAMALTGFAVQGGGAAARLLFALVLCALYNYWACERIADRAR